MSSKGANIQIEENNTRKDNILFSEGGSRIIFSLNKEEELKFLKFLKIKSNDFGDNVYVKQIGFVSEQYLDITLQNQTMCNLKVDQLSEKFNNSISSYF